MGKTKYRSIEFLSLSFAIIFSTLIAKEASNWKEFLTGWNLWIIIPYISFFIISAIANHRTTSESVSRASCFTAILLLAFTLFVYLDAFYFSSSSTSSLVLIFVPFYLLVGGPILLLIIFKILVLRLKKKRCST